VHASPIGLFARVAADRALEEGELPDVRIQLVFDAGAAIIVLLGRHGAFDLQVEGGHPLWLALPYAEALHGPKKSAS
jgi:hypothetical protein